MTKKDEKIEEQREDIKVLRFFAILLFLMVILFLILLDLSSNKRDNFKQQLVDCQEQLTIWTLKVECFESEYADYVYFEKEYGDYEEYREVIERFDEFEDFENCEIIE